MNAQWLLALALSCPLAGGVVTWLARTQLNKRLGAINLTFTALSLICVALAWLGGGRQTITFQLPGFMALGLNFELNGLTAFFALLFLAAWTATSIYCFGYMENEGSQRRFYVFLQLTLLGCIGVVLASDLITLFLFFELMTLCSYVLVIHKEDAAAMSAGNLYLFLGVFGGLALLTGIFLLYNATGTASFTAIPPAVAENTGLVAAMGIAFLLGFGIKAGIFPLHIWLPKAHPVAPTPASALLSGIMIKTGAYGLFRVFYSVLAPAG
ncbi:MAG: proton-conducting transporter membrane subunit, partial [Eubacteriales bacterium]|nr:proton-conducting transporter membrane subunit [Eubacteriales bacterium]